MKRKKLDQIAYEYIVDRIESGQLFEREHITEQKIANELEISRTPIRRAFERLEEDNYLENIANMGVRVKVQKLTAIDFQNRLDFFERLINHYLFDLEKREIALDLEEITEQVLQMEAVKSDDDQTFDKYEFQYWKNILAHEQNRYSVKVLLNTLREIFDVDGQLQYIMKDSRTLKINHYQKIIDYLKEENYAYARREIRIVVNQLKLNVIEMDHLS
ncbi:MAG TPA: GntR family transcriptional regulator [Atopostipes sp.]|nr:GntR family transcriptional regulator [Atopostipes sp.]